MIGEYEYQNFRSLDTENQIYLLKELLKPNIFCSKFLGLTLYDYQNDIINDESPLIFIQKGRQVGASYALALKAVFKSVTSPNTTIAIVSPSQRQSSLVFSYVMRFFKQHPMLKPEIDTKYGKCSETKIELANGSILHSLPCGNDGRTIRGISIPKGSLLIVDEGAYIPEKAWSSIDYFTAAGGQRIISSTPLTKYGRFYEESLDMDYKKYKIATTMNPSVDQKWIQKMKKYKSYTTEVLGEFMDGSGNFFNEDQVRACINAELSWEADPREVSGSVKYMGVDVALEVDPCVVTLISKNRQGKIAPFYIKAFKKDNGKDSYECDYKTVRSYEEIYNEIVAINGKYGTITNSCIDATFNPYLAEKLSKVMQVSEIKFNSTGKNGNPMKTELMYGLLGMIAERKIELPNHPDLIRQLVNYEHEITENKRVKFSETDEDFIDSLALAVYNEIDVGAVDSFIVSN